jgi:hypothetical protein
MLQVMPWSASSHWNCSLVFLGVGLAGRGLKLATRMIDFLSESKANHETVKHGGRRSDP